MRRRPTTPYPRRLADSVESLGRWATTVVTGPPRLAAHGVWWTATRRLDDDELDVPDLDRPLQGDAATLQRAAHGVGPLHVRRYRLVVATTADTGDAVRVLRSDIDGLVPRRFVRFRDGDGDAVEAPVTVGQEFVARLTGPRDGPVRVVAVRDDGYRLATLRGHVEAGEIDFRVVAQRAERLLVEVRSWARSGRRDVRWLYERGGGRWVQSHVWVSLCLALADEIDGTPVGRVEIASRRLEWPIGAQEPRLRS